MTSGQSIRVLQKERRLEGKLELWRNIDLIYFNL